MQRLALLHACKKEQMNEQQHYSILTSGTANRAEMDLNMEIGKSCSSVQMKIE
jgi:hypothetical protein